MKTVFYMAYLILSIIYSKGHKKADFFISPILYKHTNGNIGPLFIFIEISTGEYCQGNM